MHGHDMQRRDAADVIEEFADEISRMRGTCLDIGCGPGTVTELVMPMLPPDAKVVGKFREVVGAHNSKNFFIKSFVIVRVTRRNIHYI